MEQILLAQIITMMNLKLVGEALTYGQKSLVWQCILLDVWEFFLFLGIIHYEKFGQDSQKRSFPGILIC